MKPKLRNVISYGKLSGRFMIHVMALYIVGMLRYRQHYERSEGRLGCHTYKEERTYE